MTQLQEVKVDILLAGGHQYTVYLQSDTPLLKNLFEAVTSPSQDFEFFQVPINEGRSILSFPKKSLVGLVTEPPIFVQVPEVVKPPILPTSDILPSEYVQIEHFLTTKEKKHLINFVKEKKLEFVSTTTTTGVPDYRKSLILYSFPEFSELITNRIHAILPDVFRKLKMTPFKVSQIETQLTAHNDGNYYKIHNDNGSKDTATRELTYVYYFYQEPKAFQGGELVIYDSQVKNNHYAKANSFKKVEPKNNSIVFFLSRYLHEVLPVDCPTQSFEDSRFTINGWLRR